MIVEGLMSFFFALVRTVMQLLPSFNPPEAFTNANGWIADIWAAGAGLGAWIPWSVVGIATGMVIAAIGIGFAIKLVRIVASFLTAGGGSAA